jgi:hypothetical protein
MLFSFLSLVLSFITSTSLTSAVSSNASVPPPKTFLAILLSLQMILVAMWVNFSTKFYILNFIPRKAKMTSSVTSVMPFFILAAFRTQFFPFFLFVLERFGTFQRWKLFFSQFIVIITIVPTAIFAFCVLSRAFITFWNNLWIYKNFWFLIGP